jgi:hypothetical protein
VKDEPAELAGLVVGPPPHPSLALRAVREACLKCDTATVAGPDFHHHHAMMRGRGSMNFVDCVADGMRCSVESKRDLAGRKIVVDGHTSWQRYRVNAQAAFSLIIVAHRRRL